MHRFITTLAATAVAAAVAAAITLPAGASDDPTTTKDAKFVACLRDQGLAIPADTSGDAIKGWLLAHDNVDEAIRACKTREDGRDVKVDELIACLRAHGLNPPADIDRLKPWLAPQFGNAATREVFNACGLDHGPDEKGRAGNKPADGGPCGAKPDDAKAAAAKRATVVTAPRQ